jgi:hypothetical protein
MCTLVINCAHLTFVHTKCTLYTTCTLSSQNRTMFRARHHLIFTPSRDSTLTTSQYRGRGRCGLNGRPSSRLDGQLWRAKVGSSQLLSGRLGAKRVPRHAAESQRDQLMGRVRHSEYSRPVFRPALTSEPAEKESGFLDHVLEQV